mmetsp:Transcript_52651/g.87479  ORF Transcript_52651/g.87479 Transcript_52651/m.87479 type:complete len:496 (-) Transcript_52651:277-1764(-)|eukprot:CAMPEP_0119311338 /NCGR_PEP_ID=MMETSP1333-20130426/22048_1 /TAXON_ID=418940 /ORGANISM="Scyphosphaera apsteinii, Strain RCC1455" /LENGTH=495 /DNA_ID=CAMNT_0007315689 /DNA_START=42 /DNA_END=1529 /DNA_ORIENTATION=+
MAASLYSRDVSSVAQSNELFGSEKGLLVIRPGRSIRPWFTIPEGGYALVTRFGQDLPYEDDRPVWPAGFYWGMPWMKVQNFVTRQSVVLDMPIKGCKTHDNVTVEINLSIVFRLMGDEAKGEDPLLVRKFVYTVTPRGLEQQLRDACEEATRSVARSLQFNEVYGLRTDRSGKQTKILKGEGDSAAPPEEIEEGDKELRAVAGPSDDDQAASALMKGKNVADDMRRNLNDQFKPQGVEVSDVIITDVLLPEVIVQQMAQKTMVISQNAAQKMNQEYEMLTLKQTEEVETLRQKKKEERESEKQSGDMAVNEVQVQLDKMKTETKVLLAKIKQESRVRVQEITANGNLEVTKLHQSKEQVLTELNSKATSDAETLKAQTDLYEATKLSEAKLTASRNDALAMEHMAKAEGVAAPYVEARKQFETREKEMLVWKSLAKNKELVISGEASDELNTLMLCDAMMDAKANEATKAQVLAEMLVMQRGSKVMLNLSGQEAA